MTPLEEAVKAEWERRKDEPEMQRMGRELTPLQKRSHPLNQQGWGDTHEDAFHAVARDPHISPEAKEWLRRMREVRLR